jgi:hypothetical protein
VRREAHEKQARAGHANHGFCEQPHVQALRDKLRQRSERAGHVSDFQEHAAGLLRLYSATRVDCCRVRGVRGDGEPAHGIADCTAEFRVVASHMPRFNGLADELDIM